MPFIRDDIIAEARSWLGTPWHHQASVKGVGCDCIGFVRGVAERFVGPIPMELDYAPTWHLYRAEPRMYLGFRERCEEIDPVDALPGDILLFGVGKGLGGSARQRATTVSYHYYCDLAVGLCAGPIVSVPRVFADGNAFDPTHVGEMRIHTGSAGQPPDPLIQAVEGADRTPAYRGLAYVVLEHLHITPFGNRLPQFTFEVVT